MKRMWIGLGIVLGLAGSAWGQEGGRKEEGREGKKKEEPSLALKDIDGNKDGNAQLSELRNALARLTGKGEERKEGEGRKREGKGERERGEGRGANDPSMPLKDVDTSGDGRATALEIQTAIEKLLTKKEGEKK